MEAERRFTHTDVHELDRIIAEQHKAMLEADSLEESQEILRQLRGYIHEYLKLASHRSKFKLEETARVLSKSVLENDVFDPRDAQNAFEDLAKYAHNLCEQPWRREFRRISLVSGFFMHNIRSQLCDAQDLLILLGYTGTDDYTLELHGFPGEDILLAFSRDCFVAGHECLILSQIWEKVQRQVPNNPLTLLEAWEARKKFAGDVDSVCTSLVAEARKRIYQQEEEEKELQKRREHEHFQQLLEKAKLAPPPEVPVDNNLVDLGGGHGQNCMEHEIVKRVLQNTEKENPVLKLYSTTATKYHVKDETANSHRPRYPHSSAAQYNSPSASAIPNGYSYSSRSGSGTGVVPVSDERANSKPDEAAELEELIMEKFKNGDVPSGQYRPTDSSSSSSRGTTRPERKEEREEPYYSPVPVVPAVEVRQTRDRDFAFEPLLNEAKEKLKSDRVHENKTDKTEEGYSMLLDAQEMIGTVRGRVTSKPIDCLSAFTTSAQAPEPMDISPRASPKNFVGQEKASPSQIPVPTPPSLSSSGFKSLSRKQDLPKSSNASGASGESEKEKKPTTKDKIKTLLKGGGPKGKDKEKSANKAADGRHPIKLGEFPLERSKISDPENSSNANANSNCDMKTFSDKIVDEVDQKLNQMQLDEEESENSILDATLTADKTKENEWDCKHCTFKNKEPHKICTICSKSRDLPPECPESAKPSTSPPKSSAGPPKKSDWPWTEVVRGKKGSKSKNQGSKKAEESDWPGLAPSSTTKAVYDTSESRRATAESKSAYFSNKEKDQKVSVPGTIGDEDPGCKIECPKCTYLNDPTRYMCEICLEKLQP